MSAPSAATDHRYAELDLNLPNQIINAVAGKDINCDLVAPGICLA